MISPVKLWRHQKKVSLLLGQEAKIVSWTLIRVPPTGYEEEAPYPVVLARLSSGEKIVGQLVDWKEKDLKFGRKVLAVYRRVCKPDPEGVIAYGIKFTPMG